MTNLNVILGGTGKTGRRVAARLRARGVATRVASRSRDGFDWTDRATWPRTLDGAAGVYLCFAPDLAVPGAAETIGALAEQATAAGVSRLVLLSGRGEPEAERAEQAVRQALPQATVVRCSWFNQNFSESFLLEPILAGAVALPVDGVPEPFVDAEDVADVAAAALTESGHAGRVYELTGPRPLTFDDAVAAIAAATKRPIRFAPVSLSEFAAGLQVSGVPDEVVALLRYLFGEVLDGRNAHPVDGVMQALGRPPRDFTAYAQATAASGVWTPPDRSAPGIPA